MPAWLDEFTAALDTAADAAAAAAAEPAAAGALDVLDGELKLLEYVPPSNSPSCIFSVADPNF